MMVQSISAVVVVVILALGILLMANPPEPRLVQESVVEYVVDAKTYRKGVGRSILLSDSGEFAEYRGQVGPIGTRVKMRRSVHRDWSGEYITWSKAE